MAIVEGVLPVPGVLHGQIPDQHHDQPGHTGGMRWGALSGQNKDDFALSSSYKIKLFFELKTRKKINFLTLLTVLFFVISRFQCTVILKNLSVLGHCVNLNTVRYRISFVFLLGTGTSTGTAIDNLLRIRTGTEVCQDIQYFFIVFFCMFILGLKFTLCELRYSVDRRLSLKFYLLWMF
jgi:hypothetical protein